MSLADYLGTYVVEYVKGQMNNKIAGRCPPLFCKSAHHLLWSALADHADAIDYAIEHDSLQPIELVLKYGADPNVYMTSIGQPCQVPGSCIRYHSRR